MEGVQACVHNSIKQLSGTAVASNSMPLSPYPEDRATEYRMPARGKEELLATQPQAAQAGHTNPVAAFNNLNDPAAKLGGAKMVQVSEDVMLPDQNQIVLPKKEDPPKPPSKNGWTL